MNLLNKIIYACLVIAFAQLRIQAQDCEAQLTISTNNDTALIYINNSFVGTGNINKFVKKGSYKIDILSDSLRWGSENIHDSIKVAACNPIVLNFKFKDKKLLQTNPEDAYVYSKDSLIAHTPTFINQDISKLSLQKPGYQNKGIFLSDITSTKPIILKYDGKPYEKSFYERDLFKYLVAGVVVLGASTAYFKLKADNKFNNYERTGNDSYLSETRKYDLISGITMGALQINFGILIYYFLTD